MASVVELGKTTISEFLEDECPRMAAALSYYTIFSIPPLLILILLLLGTFFDPQDVQGAIEGQIQALMGPEGSETIRTVLAHAQEPDVRAPVAAILGLGALIFGATGAFGELQAALNRAWGVQPDPDQGGLKSFLTKRVFSFGMILGVAFLLLVSLVLSAVLAALGETLAGMLPGLSGPLLMLLNVAISFGVITLLFATIYKVLPDAVIAWRDVWVGALFTTFLFVLGKYFIGLYLGQSDPGQAYGAAGSLVLMLVWVYYSSMILLLGAEFTQAWAESRGGGIRPEEGAVRVERQMINPDEQEAETTAG